MDNKAYHSNIYNLVPCLEHGYKMADYVKEIQVKIESEDIPNKKANIEYLIFWERSLRGSLSQSDVSNLTDSQLSMFNDVQSRILDYLSTESFK